MDRANQIEASQQIRFLAQRVLRICAAHTARRTVKAKRYPSIEAYDAMGFAKCSPIPRATRCKSVRGHPSRRGQEAAPHG
jgi:hypothetical protein